MQGDAYLVFVGVEKSHLEGTKQASSPRHCRSHESEFPKHSLPFLNANSALVMEVLKDVKDPVLLLLSKLQGSLRCVQDPTQDFLPLAPSSFSFQELLFGYGFLVLCCHFIWLQEDVVHCVHDALAGITTMVLRALCDSNKSIDKNIHV